MVGDGHRPTLTVGMIAAGVRHFLPPSGTRGLFKYHCVVPNHDRQRPLPTCIHRDDNRRLLSVWGGLTFFYFHFYALFGVLLKSMGESFLLSDDEPLTPNIDGVKVL